MPQAASAPNASEGRKVRATTEIMMFDQIRYNASSGALHRSKLPEDLALRGGRGFISKILHSEMNAAADPLGPDNRLIVCNGLLAGTAAPSSGRVSIGTKSPLTGTIKEANAGGAAGTALATLGLRGIVVEGSPEADGLKVLVVDSEGQRIDDGQALAGLGAYDTCERLRAKYGEDAVFLCIGPAGENGYFNSSVQVSDLQGRPARAAARGGVGAVFASKGLKAIVLIAPGKPKPDYVHPDAAKLAAKEYKKALLKHPITSQALPALGTAVLVNLVNEMGAMPTRNYSEGRFDGAADLSGENMAAIQEPRNGQMRHACQKGCVIACSNVYHGPDGNYLTSGFEYETIALNGSNLGINDLDVVAQIDRLCDDFGLDTMETGVTIGIAMENGLLEFGDAQGAIEMVREMGLGTDKGRSYSQGAERFGKSIGAKRIPAIKGQALAGYDPRGLKGTGVTCATSPMGADHTAGNTLGIPGLVPNEAEGQIPASKGTQVVMATFDCLGMCIFAGFVLEDPANIQLLADMLAGQYGGEWNPDKVLGLGMETIRLEKSFNEWAGIRPEADDIPEFFRNEPLAPLNSVFDIPQDDLSKVFSDE